MSSGGGYLTVIKRDGNVGASRPIESGSTVIGTAPSCSIRIFQNNKKEFAARQCTITVHPTETTIKNLSFETPTLVNNESFETRVLINGDIISFGGITFKWEYFNMGPKSQIPIRKSKGTTKKDSFPVLKTKGSIGRRKSESIVRKTDPKLKNIIGNKGRSSLSVLTGSFTSNTRQVAIVKPQRRNVDFSDDDQENMEIPILSSPNNRSRDNNTSFGRRRSKRASTVSSPKYFKPTSPKKRKGSEVKKLDSPVVLDDHKKAALLMLTRTPGNRNNISIKSPLAQNTPQEKPSSAIKPLRKIFNGISSASKIPAKSKTPTINGRITKPIARSAPPKPTTGEGVLAKRTLLSKLTTPKTLSSGITPRSSRAVSAIKNLTQVHGTIVEESPIRSAKKILPHKLNIRNSSLASTPSGILKTTSTPSGAARKSVVFAATVSATPDMKDVLYGDSLSFNLNGLDDVTPKQSVSKTRLSAKVLPSRKSESPKTPANTPEKSITTNVELTPSNRQSLRINPLSVSKTLSLRKSKAAKSSPKISTPVSANKSIGDVSLSTPKYKSRTSSRTSTNSPITPNSEAKLLATPDSIVRTPVTPRSTSTRNSTSLKSVTKRSVTPKSTTKNLPTPKSAGKTPKTITPRSTSSRNSRSIKIWAGSPEDAHAIYERLVAQSPGSFGFADNIPVTPECFTTRTPKTRKSTSSITKKTPRSTSSRKSKSMQIWAKSPEDAQAITSSESATKTPVTRRSATKSPITPRSTSSRSSGSPKPASNNPKSASKSPITPRSASSQSSGVPKSATTSPITPRSLSSRKSATTTPKSLTKSLSTPSSTSKPSSARKSGIKISDSSIVNVSTSPIATRKSTAPRTSPRGKSLSVSVTLSTSKRLSGQRSPSAKKSISPNKSIKSPPSPRSNSIIVTTPTNTNASKIITPSPKPTLQTVSPVNRSLRNASYVVSTPKSSKKAISKLLSQPRRSSLKAIVNQSRNSIRKSTRTDWNVTSASNLFDLSVKSTATPLPKKLASKRTSSSPKSPRSSRKSASDSILTLSPIASPTGVRSPRTPPSQSPDLEALNTTPDTSKLFELDASTPKKDSSRSSSRIENPTDSPISSITRRSKQLSKTEPRKQVAKNDVSSRKSLNLPTRRSSKRDSLIVTPKKSNYKFVPELLKEKHSTAKKSVSRKIIIDSRSERKDVFSSPLRRKLSQSLKQDSLLLANDALDDSIINASFELLYGNSLDQSSRKSVSSPKSPAKTSPVKSKSATPVKSPRRNVSANDLSNISGIAPLFLTPKPTRSSTHNTSIGSNRSSRSSTNNTPVKSPRLSIVKKTPTPAKSPKPSRVAKSPKNDLTNVSGVKKLLATPRTQRSPKNDLTNVSGVKRLLKTPKPAKSPRLSGVKKILATPRVVKSPKNDLRNVAGVKALLKTPKPARSPKNDLTDVSGVRRLLKTPKPAKSPKLSGVKNILKTPRLAKSPKNDLTNVSGVKKLLKTPKPIKSPRLSGVKHILKTPRAAKSPKNNLSNVLPVSSPKKAAKTPSPKKSPRGLPTINTSAFYKKPSESSLSILGHSTPAKGRKGKINNSSIRQLSPIKPVSPSPLKTRVTRRGPVGVTKKAKITKKVKQELITASASSVEVVAKKSSLRVDSENSVIVVRGRRGKNNKAPVISSPSPSKNKDDKKKVTFASEVSTRLVDNPKSRARSSKRQAGVPVEVAKPAKKAAPSNKKKASTVKVEVPKDRKRKAETLSDLAPRASKRVKVTEEAVKKAASKKSSAKPAAKSTAKSVKSDKLKKVAVQSKTISKTKKAPAKTKKASPVTITKEAKASPVKSKKATPVKKAVKASPVKSKKAPKPSPIKPKKATKASPVKPKKVQKASPVKSKANPVKAKKVQKTSPVKSRASPAKRSLRSRAK